MVMTILSKPLHYDMVYNRTSLASVNTGHHSKINHQFASACNPLNVFNEPSDHLHQQCLTNIAENVVKIEPINDRAEIQTVENGNSRACCR